jgi:DNA-binding GntR family transcriptional regulator
MAGNPGAAAPVDVAYERLRQGIVTGRLAANEHLVEADLVAELGVSRGTIRTVLARLEHEGLVEREYNHGAHVRMVSVEEAVEILQARSALEALGARFAALHASEAELAELHAILGRMPEFIAAGDLLGYSAQNSRLHSHIVRTSQHAVTQRLISGLNAQMVRFQYRTILVPGRPAKSFREHTAVAEAIIARDEDAAETAMRYHLSQVASTLLEIANDPTRRANTVN